MTISTATANAAFFAPIARAFVRAGARPNSILTRISDAANTTKDLLLPIPLIYKAIENEADELNDLTLGFRAGSLFANIAFRELFPSEHEKKSLPSAILDLSIWLSKNTTGTPMQLAVSSESATLSQKRGHLRAETTAQADAFSVAVMIETIRLHVRDQYEPEKIAIAISRPGLLPNNVLHLNSLKALAHSGFMLEFPVDWLLSPQGEWGIDQSKRLIVKDNFLSAFDSALRDIIGIPLPKLARTAELLNFTPRELQVELELRGTTFTQVTTRINCEFATDQLIAGEMTATRIGELLGYSDHSSFSRAFKSWTGMSPEQFKASRAQSDNPSSPSSAS